MFNELIQYLKRNKIRRLKNRIAYLEVEIEEENKYSGVGGFLDGFEVGRRVHHKAELANLKSDLKSRLENES